MNSKPPDETTVKIKRHETMQVTPNEIYDDERDVTSDIKKAIRQMRSIEDLDGHHRSTRTVNHAIDARETLERILK